MNVQLTIVRGGRIEFARTGIFPEHQRKGYATKCIAELIATYYNIQFTVSMYNKNSIRFFESLNCLNKTEFRLQNRTFIFREFKKPTAKEIYL
jgi:hypothetical protein